MTLRASARAMAVGFAAFAVLCPERSSAEVVDVCKLSQQLAALFDKIGVIPSSHPQLRLYPNKGNRHPSENTAFLKFSKSGRAPTLFRRANDFSAVRGGTQTDLRSEGNVFSEGDPFLLDGRRVEGADQSSLEGISLSGRTRPQSTNLPS